MLQSGHGAEVASVIALDIRTVLCLLTLTKAWRNITARRVPALAAPAYSSPLSILARAARPNRCEHGAGRPASISMEARAATLTLALLALAAAAAAGPADFPWLFPDSNKGLKPTRLVTFGSTHYYQMAENPVGTVVSLSGWLSALVRAAGPRRLHAAAFLVCPGHWWNWWQSPIAHRLPSCPALCRPFSTAAPALPATSSHTTRSTAQSAWVSVASALPSIPWLSCRLRSPATVPHWPPHSAWLAGACLLCIHAPIPPCPSQPPSYNCPACRLPRAPVPHQAGAGPGVQRAGAGAARQQGPLLVLLRQGHLY